MPSSPLPVLLAAAEVGDDCGVGWLLPLLLLLFVVAVAVGKGSPRTS